MSQKATQLISAAENGDVATVRSLLTAGRVDVNVTNEDNTTPLYWASRNGHHDVVQSLLAAGADVEIATKRCAQGPLWTASLGGYLNVVKMLLGGGANVNQASKENTTPLHVASQNGHHDVVQSLLAAGADVNIASYTNLTPLWMASQEGHHDVVQSLLAAGADVNIARSTDNTTPLYMASQNGHHDVVQSLLTAGADVNIARSDNGWSPLCGASFNGHCAVVKTLIEAGANVNQITKNGKTALDIAVEKGHNEIIQVLKTSQIKVIKTLVPSAKERVTRAEQGAGSSRQQFSVPQGTPQDSEHMKPPWRVERDEIEVEEEKPLGVGGWGEVRVATFRGIRVAAKFIHEAIISPHNIDLFVREMNIAASVRHPNLLLFIGASLDNNKPVILTELMQANLRSVVETPSKPLTRVHVVSISTDVASGLNYLHLMRPDPIIHRDISSANVLLECFESGSYRAKVSDYGSANFLSKVITRGPGNASYAAPESMNPKRQSPKMDVYSYGILLLEMATRKFPDYNLQEKQLDTLPWQQMAAMIRRCICEDPANRPTMKEILNLLPQINK